MVRHETEMNQKRGLRERIVGEEQLELVKDIGEQAGLGQPCSICGGPIAILGSWKLGNNAQPINNGRCCDKCDKEVVIPARMKRAKEGWDDLRAVEPNWQIMGQTVLEDIRRDAVQDKLEQALLNAGLVKPPGIDPTPTELATLRSFRNSGRGKAFDLKNPGMPDDKTDVTGLLKWLASGGFKLKAPQHPLMHKALRALTIDEYLEPTACVQSILVRHDWAAVLGDSLDTQGEWTAPYDHQIFELLIEGTWRTAPLDGQRVALPVLALMATKPQSMLLLLRTGKDKWVCDKYLLQLLPDGFREYPDTRINEIGTDLSPLRKLVYRQVRACSIMIEARVAETKPMRDMTYKRNVPPKDNSAPLPKLGYNIVELADRHRVERLPPGPITSSMRRRPRLHFRCAHWRHFATHRTRIPWTLAGNPELGFVEKEYRL